MLAIRLPEKMEDRLDKLAKSTGRTKSFYVREALVEYLADREDIYLAEKELIRHRKEKKKRTISHEVLRKRYGLAG